MTKTQGNKIFKHIYNNANKHFINKQKINKNNKMLKMMYVTNVCYIQDMKYFISLSIYIY